MDKRVSIPEKLVKKIEPYIEAGYYTKVGDFVREAIREKLQRLEKEAVA